MGAVIRIAPSLPLSRIELTPALVIPSALSSQYVAPKAIGCESVSSSTFFVGNFLSRYRTMAECVSDSITAKTHIFSAIRS
jgi:hypothetical protein